MLNEILKNYLKNTIVTKPAIASRLVNPITNIRYATRLLYVRLRKYSSNFFNTGTEPRFISLSGIRGIGKTILLWHTTNHIFQKHNKDIFFFNVNTLNNLGIDINIALEEFQNHILKKRFKEITVPFTLLFDEVQDDKNWSKTLNNLYDEAPTAFILCTGSSELLLNQTDDIADKMHIEKMYPFRFTEYIAAKSSLETAEMLFPEKGLSEILTDAIFYSETSQEAFTKIKAAENDINDYFKIIYKALGIPLCELRQEYINHKNIPNFLSYKEKYPITNTILDLFNRVILEDIPKLNPTLTDFTKIDRFVHRLAWSDGINPEKLSSIIDVKQHDINELIDALSKVEILNVLKPHNDLDSQIVKNKKAFFMSPSLRKALLTTIYGQRLPDQFKSKLVEDVVVMYLKRIFTDDVVSFTLGNNEITPDFVIETLEKPIFLEMGSRQTTTRQIRQSDENYRYIALVSNLRSVPYHKENCIHIPLSWFLLL